MEDEEEVAISTDEVMTITLGKVAATMDAVVPPTTWVEEAPEGIIITKT